jgi:hypothetical protein
MKTISLTIPDDEFDAFMKLISEFKSIQISEGPDSLVIPEWHKKVLDERIESAVEEDFIPWEKARKSIRSK